MGDTHSVFRDYSWTGVPDEGIDVFVSLVEYGVKLSGRTKNRSEDITFYLAIFRSAVEAGGWVTGIAIRKTGTPASPDRLAAMGIRKNVKISVDYLNTLNIRGLSDRRGSADSIAGIVNRALHCHKDLVRDAKVFGVDEPIRLRPSNAAAGPCPIASGLSGHPFTYETAPILPVDRCSRPDQCGCRYAVIEYE